MAYRIEHSDNADDVRKERKEDLETVKRIRESWENMKMEYSIDKEEDPVFDEETRKESLENSDYDDSDRLWEELDDDDEEEFSFDEETGKESMDNHEDEYGASIPDIKDIYDSIRFDELNDIRQNKSRAGELKRYLTEVLHLYNYLRLAECDDNNLNRNESFYGALNEVIFALSDIVSIYNKTRNFITKKLSEIKKVKLNFDCSTLLGG